MSNNNLLGDQDFSGDVLEAKRLMKDFVSVTGATKHRREDTKPTDVAFVEMREAARGGGTGSARL